MKHFLTLTALLMALPLFAQTHSTLPKSTDPTLHPSHSMKQESTKKTKSSSTTITPTVTPTKAGSTSERTDDSQMQQDTSTMPSSGTSEIEKQEDISSKPSSTTTEDMDVEEEE
jgi:hypothetical protein